MRAAVMNGIREPLTVQEIKDPELRADGAIVQVEANGICRSDWHAWTGDWSWFGLKLTFPHVLGHEFCGVVVETAPGVTRFKKGDRVLVPFSQGEGTCDWCRNGQHHVCDRRVTPGVNYWGGWTGTAESIIDESAGRLEPNDRGKILASFFQRMCNKAGRK
jgi:D-arabinose 1-dehydrogenase-like Zn-dependent alcohol dehydrogenase